MKNMLSLLAVALIWTLNLGGDSATALKKPNIEIMSTFPNPLPVVGEFPNFDAVYYQGASVDVGMEHLRSTHGHLFEFNHTYLVSDNRDELAEDAENFIANFYFNHEKSADGFAFIAPCKFLYRTSAQIWR